MAEMSWYLNMLGSVIVLIALVLAWPHWGAGDGPGGERVATGIAWHVEASANVFVPIGVRVMDRVASALPLASRGMSRLRQTCLSGYARWPGEIFVGETPS
ncbi:hypothetical protein A0J57_23120 [Sphingobium sp. 22B]|nr:hypothetical protein A0J57_23120 [Sphingobium sp. 22B]